MSSWQTYRARLEVWGRTKRERKLRQMQEYLSSKSRDSLSGHTVEINGVAQDVIILNQREDMSSKKICSMPGEILVHGGLVDFANSKWLITEIDANDELYSSAIMKRCNHLLRWINRDGKIVEKWCIAEDGTKYLIGEKTSDLMAIGDARIAITVGKDSDTIEIGRGKRFLVDDEDSGEVLAYQVTKSNRLFNVYNGEGVFRYILNEVNMTDNDNKTLRIADYYNWKPYVKTDYEHEDADIPIETIVESAKNQDPPDDGKKVWL